MLTALILSTLISLSLEWDANPETNIAGYKVYIGLSSRIYSPPHDVGNVTRYTVEGLEDNVRYYFAVTAYDTDGLESDYSDEVWFINPIRLYLTSTGIEASLLTNRNYVLEKSYNLTDWAGSQYITPDKNLVQFPISKNEPYAFYRLFQLDTNPFLAIQQSVKTMTAKIYRPEIPVITKLSNIDKMISYLKYNPKRYLKPRETKGAKIEKIGKRERLPMPPSLP